MVTDRVGYDGQHGRGRTGGLRSGSGIRFRMSGGLPGAKRDDRGREPGTGNWKVFDVAPSRGGGSVLAYGRSLRQMFRRGVRWSGKVPGRLNHVTRRRIRALEHFTRAEASDGHTVWSFSMKIYVGNMSYDTTEEGLEQLFSNYGQVDEVAVITDRDTGRPRGFAFVTMANDDEARQAIEALNNTEFEGRTLNVNEARPREDRGGGGGRGGRGGGGGGQIGRAHV